MERASRLLLLFAAVLSAAVLCAAQAQATSRTVAFVSLGTLYYLESDSRECPDAPGCSPLDQTYASIRMDLLAQRSSRFLNAGVSLGRTAHFLEGMAGWTVIDGERADVLWGAGPSIMFEQESRTSQAARVPSLGLLLEGKLVFGDAFCLQLRTALRYFGEDQFLSEFTVGVGGG